MSHDLSPRRLSHHPRPEAARRQHRQRGAVMVEAAIALPLMVLLAFGIITFGQAYSNATITAGSTRTGARLASATYVRTGDRNLGTQANTIAAAVAVDLNNLQGATPVSHVDPYKADATTGFTFTRVLPSFTTCGTNCISYAWNSTTKAWGSSSGSWTGLPNGCTEPLDYVGVYVKVTDPLKTGLFGTQTITINQHTVMRIEPVSNVLCSS